MRRRAMFLALAVVLAATTVSSLVLAVLDLFGFFPALDTETAASRGQGLYLLGPAGILALLADSHLPRVAPVRTWPRAPAARADQVPSAICTSPAGPIPTTAM